MFTFPVGFLAQDDPYTQNDPYWNNVSLLLPMTGTNGSTTFTDYSPTPKTITANGNAQISTAQSKFGNGSGYFDGSGDFLSGNLGSESFNIRTDSYTIEGFAYRTDTGSSFIIVASQGNDFYPLQMFNNIWYVGDGTINTLAVSGQTPALNTWTYMALTFNGTTYRLYKDGVLIGSSTALLKNYTYSNFQIGARTAQGLYSLGHLNHVRFTKGIVRDVSVVPTAPFPIG